MSQPDTETTPDKPGSFTAVKVIMTVVATLVTLALCECAFRAYLSFVNIHDMEMHKYARQLKQRSTVEGLHHEHIPSCSARLMGVEVKTNNLGFRSNWQPEEVCKDENRVLVVGNSITLGWGVEFSKVFTELAEVKINTAKAYIKAVRVINAGVGNMDTLQEEKMLESRIGKVKPAVVVLHFYLDDIEPVEEGNAGWLIKNSYMAALTYIRIRQSAYQATASHAAATEGGGIGAFYARLYADSNPNWLNARDAILRMKKLAENNGANFAVLIQPDLHDISNKAAQWEALDFVEKSLRDAHISTEQVALRLRGQHPTPSKTLWVAEDDPHPNTTGHAAMSESLTTLVQSVLRESTGNKPTVAHSRTFDAPLPHADE